MRKTLTILCLLLALAFAVLLGLGHKRAAAGCLLGSFLTGAATAERPRKNQPHTT